MLKIVKHISFQAVILVFSTILFAEANLITDKYCGVWSVERISSDQGTTFEKGASTDIMSITPSTILHSNKSIKVSGVLVENKNGVEKLSVSFQDHPLVWVFWLISNNELRVTVYEIANLKSYEHHRFVCYRIK